MNSNRASASSGIFAPHFRHSLVVCGSRKNCTNSLLHFGQRRSMSPFAPTGVSQLTGFSGAFLSAEETTGAACCGSLGTFFSASGALLPSYSVVVLAMVSSVLSAVSSSVGLLPVSVTLTSGSP